MPALPGRPRAGALRAVLFDVGGTLLDVADPESWQAEAASLGIAVEADRLAAGFREALERFDPGPPGESDAEFWQSVLERGRDRPVASHLAQAFLSRIRARPIVPRLYSDVRFCLEELRRRRLTLGIISNSASEAAVRGYLQAAGIAGLFAGITSSGTEGVRKPDPEIFRRALARMGLAPGEALYVGDLRHTDVDGARAVGMRAVWLHRDGTGLEEEITSLSELPGLIARRPGRSR